MFIHCCEMLIQRIASHDFFLRRSEDNSAYNPRPGKAALRPASASMHEPWKASPEKNNKKPRSNRGFQEAQTGFEPVHQGVADPRLTTWLLRLTFYLIICCIDFKNDSNGNRTRVTAVKGRCLNRLTMEPGYSYLSCSIEKAPFRRGRLFQNASNALLRI